MSPPPRLAAPFAAALFCMLAAVPVHAGFSEALESYVANNFSRAFVEAETAAERGNPAAQWLLGTMYLLGQGTDENPATARQWFARAAAENYPPAQAV
jgi:TPR repeat protein